MRKFYLLLITLSGCWLHASAQEPGPASLRRLSAAAIKKTTDTQTAVWWLICKDTSILSKHLIKIGGSPILRHDPQTGLTVVQARFTTLAPLLGSDAPIRYIDKPRIPKEELTIVTFDASANQINTIQHFWPDLNGRNTVLSVKERKLDTADIDFRNRFLSTSLADASNSNHASVMATMAAGAGNSHFTGKGAASGATISSASFASLLPETDTDYNRYGITVQNHSYGTGIENYYGADALAYDASVIAKPALVHVFSAGNEGLSTPNGGVYTNLPGFANLTGSFKMAKNIITVGAVDSFYNIAALSSRGPAYDGRLKPELMAYGQDGSSGAAAIVSGIALVIQQTYQENTNFHQLPPAELVKAILINSADDIGNDGPDYASGFGNANAMNALLTTKNNRYFTGSLQSNESKSFTIDIPAGIRQLKATLCWTDPPADPTSSKALVNDLDLQLTHTSSGTITLPWILSHAANIDSLNKPTRRGTDTLNNTEQITINTPAPGEYQVRINSSQLNNGTQSFAIAWDIDTANHWSWYAPTGSDRIRGGVNYMVRWSSGFVAATGRLEYSISNGPWQSIGDVNLEKKCYRWNVPDIDAIVRLRITVGAAVFQSDEFVVSSRITGFTGFNCTDSFLLAWNKATNVQQWQVYTIGEEEKYLRPVINKTSDTIAVFKKSERSELLYAIAPLINGRPGQKSFTFDYTSQGAGCYIKSFLAFLNQPAAAGIATELGTLYQVKKISLEKITPAGTLTMQEVNPPAERIYQWQDDNLLQGENIYRLKLELESGQLIYSNPEKVLAVLNGNYLVWPNPVAAHGGIWIHAGDFNEAGIQVYTIQGQLVKAIGMVNYPQWLSVAGLKSGLYFLIIRKEGRIVHKTRLLVQ